MTKILDWRHHTVEESVNLTLKTQSASLLELTCVISNNSHTVNFPIDVLVLWDSIRDYLTEIPDHEIDSLGLARRKREAIKAAKEAIND